MPFGASPILCQKLSAGSRAWLSRQSRDPYVKLRHASPNAYRARSAFKLLELDATWGRFLSKKDVRAIVDLGAAPGGWSQVVAEKLGWIALGAPHLNNDDDASGFQLGYVPGPGIGCSDVSDSWRTKHGRGTVVSVDLLPMSPIPGVHSMQMDFLSPQAGLAIKAALSTPENPSGMADIILSDMAANFSGYKTRDVESSLDICHSVFNFAKDNLRPHERNKGGTLLLKHFAHPLLQEFRKELLEPNFHSVHYIKPTSSRTESAEGYWLCRGWKGAKTDTESSCTT